MAKEQSSSDIAELMTAAATWGDVSLLDDYLKDGADPNTVNRKGDTALHVACLYGEIECANTLLLNNANVNAVGAEGKTPLHKAVLGASILEPGPSLHTKESIYGNQINLVKLLVGCGADLKATDSEGNTPRDLAIQNDFYECADVLTDLAGMQEKYKQAEERRKQVEELQKACTDGDLATVKKLLVLLPEQLNAPVANTKLTLLMIASAAGHKDIVDHLIDNGATPSKMSDRAARTALHFAAENGHIAVVTKLMKRLPRILQYDDSHDGTSLHLAARAGHAHIVKTFLDAATRAKGFRTPCKQPNIITNTSSSLEYVEEIPPECFINVLSTSPQDNRTPLHEAVIGGHKEVVELIVNWLKENPHQSHGLLPSATNTPLSSPLPSQLHPPTTPMTPTITRTPSVSSNSGIDSMTTRGRTPLQEAVKQSNIEIADILLKNGADINMIMRPALDIRANTDITALVESSLACNIDMVRFLLKKGATDARLKALSRVLRIKKEEAIQIAGVLLCYNSTVSVDSSLIELRRRAGKDSSKFPLPLIVNWAGKKLPFINRTWLSMPMVESDLPKANQYCITQLNVSENNLHDLPIEVFQIESLQRLEVGRNNLQSLPISEEETENSDYMGWKCFSLSYLDICHNQLESLPSVLFKLPELKEFMANHNCIESIPIAFWSAPRLQKFLIQHNRISSFPSPTVNRDSGFGTLDNQLELSRALQTSMSVGDVPSDAMTPPISRSRHTQPTPTLPNLSRGRLQTSPSLFSRMDKRSSLPTGTSAPRSRLLELFSTEVGGVGFEEEVEFEVFDSSGAEEGNVFSLESLDVSHNRLTSVPECLSCLAPQLKRLHLHHNKLKSLGYIIDYPVDLELLDVSFNDLSTAIACAPSRESIRQLPCAQKLLQLSSTPESYTPLRCSHRSHKVLKKLGYLKLSNNELVDLQLFRTVEIRKVSSDPELTSSLDTPRPKRRSTETLTTNLTELRKNGGGSAGKNSSGDSGEGSSTKDGGKEEVQYCLYPQLSTLDIGFNKLKAVPAHLELITTLAVLTISHNKLIDTLPLELSTLDGLWSLEYDGVPLTSPLAEDLDRFRSASDKLLYMRALLHDSKPNESMKLMLVGLQKQGKTTLLSRLREINEVDNNATTFTERVTGADTAASMSTSFRPAALLKRFGPREAPLSTVGVDLGIWKYRKDLEPSFRAKKGSKQLRSVTFYTWDFGGQEEYYATHQCFLSFRSLYLVIFNMSDGEEGIDKLGPWLHNIQARAPDSPVIIIGTHLDTIKGEIEKDKRKKELRDYIQNKYQFGRPVSQIRELGLPQIKEVLFVGCTSIGRGEGVAELRMTLWDIAFSLTIPRKKGMGGAKSKLLEQQIPSSYLMLQEEIRKLAAQSQQEDDATPVMREAEFREATKHIISHPRELDQAVTFLHDNGILLHYSTPALNHLYFVDPQWLCDMLAHVVTVPEVNRFVQRGSGPEAGILKTSVLSHLYKGKLFPQAHRKEYMELLGKFEVALQLDHTRLLVPSMLLKTPNYTIHRFQSVFPRPPLANILSIAIGHMLEEEGHLLLPYSASTDPLLQQDVPRKFSDSPSLHRTGLLLRRFYFMTYVPSGFWPRLISRFLTSFDFPVTVLKAIGFSEEVIESIIPKFISGESSSKVSLEWSYWTTGVELWYQGWSILRVSEIRPEGTYEGCDSSPLPGHLPRTEPIEPAVDTDDLSFRLNNLWMAVDQTPNTGLEILIPDYICPSILKLQYPVHKVSPAANNKETTPPSEDGSSGEDSELSEPTIPLQETSWMSAQLLALTVDQIDTLLEDWYPGIGAKDSGKNMYSIPYVNRVVPCPYCVNNSREYTEQRLRTVSVLDTSDLKPVDTHFNESTEMATPISPSPRPVRRTLLPSFDKTIESPNLRRRLRMEDGSLPIATTSIDGESSLPTQQLVQASKFGFMIESCIAAARGLEKEALVCPSHPTHNMDLHSLVPDLMFGDLYTHFIVDDQLLDQGKYVTSGSFGEIYHGAVYPHKSAKDDEGMEVAIKMDKQDHKHFNIDNAAKAYSEIRGEVAILKDLEHKNVIKFIGIVLNPLCFILEWAPLGSLHGILTSYSNTDTRISPWTLSETAQQVAAGLEYLHYKRVVYYDLKSPNILVFMFPSPSDTAQVAMGYQTLPVNKFPILVKIADMGISRKLTPGGVVGYKGTPAFMAPEILSYVGKEACTEKVDIFSFGMFLYELVSLQFPFERQNLMHNQIEKLITEGDRPPLQTRELNNPLLFLDIMKWAWQQDYHNRPSASQLKEVLGQPSVSLLVNAYPLQPFTFPKVIASCLVTLPVDISLPDGGDGEGDMGTLRPGAATYHVHGDLQEEVWICSEGQQNPDTGVVNTCINVVTFHGKAKFDVDSTTLVSCPVSCMVCVNQTVWVGTRKGQVLIFDATSHLEIFSRYLSVNSDQGIVHIDHITKLRQVIVVRKDGCLLLFDESLSEHLMPDASHFDNFFNNTQLPVKYVFNTLQTIVTAKVISTGASPESATIWCGSLSNTVVTVKMGALHLSDFERLHVRPLAESTRNDIISHMCLMKVKRKVGMAGIEEEVRYLWMLGDPVQVLYLWDVEKKRVLSSYPCDNFAIDKVTDMISINSYLYISTVSGTITTLYLNNDLLLSSPCDPFSAHTSNIFSLLLLSSRIFPRQWLPKLVGRSNAIEYYKDLLDEEEIEDISSRMIGHHSLLLVSIGQGFYGITKNKLSLPSESSSDVFLLLWLLPR